MRAASRLRNDLDALIQRDERLHQSVKRNVLELVAMDLGHHWRVHAGDRRCLGPAGTTGRSVH